MVDTPKVTSVTSSEAPKPAQTPAPAAREPQAPSAALVKAPGDTAACKDSRGRTFTIKKLGVLDRMRVFKAIGPEQSKNEMYLGYAVLASAVVEIDGQREPFPVSDAMILARVDKLGDEGFAAISARYKEVWPEAVEDADKDAIKNS